MPKISVLNQFPGFHSLMRIKKKKHNISKIMKQGGPDDFQTPPKALLPLFPYLKKDWIIWECACGKGNLTNKLKQKGFKVVSTDIKMTKDKRLSFFKYAPRFFNCIITNPPFSKKTEFIEKCYKLKVPFALLLPLSALETKKRQEQWKKGLQIIILNERLHFETPDNKQSHCWFASAWFTYGLNLPKDITFVEIKLINPLI